MAVSFEADGAIGYITLDKPPANSYDKDFMEELGAAVDAAAADDDVKVVIVRSASKKFFSAGADIKAFMANDTATNMAMIERGHEVLAVDRARSRRCSSPRSRATRSAAGWRSRSPATCASAPAGSYKLGVPGGDARPAARQRRHAAAAADHRRPEGARPDDHRPPDQPGRGARARHPQPAVPGRRDRRQDPRVRGSARRRRHRRDRRDQARRPTRASRCRSPTRSRASARGSRGCSRPRTRRRASASFTEKRKPEFKGA